uniref:Zinc finger, CCHC-type n=1 Tax=Tanacetum cinerariifolium TaxID=118510 RepID=A0A699GRW5_TANCI|nr:zinc finger, CCHC-type [Tanacetum cinerariifolium]
MHSMTKTLVELHAMLKLYDKGILKKDETPDVLAIREGKIQKDKKKLKGAKGKANGKNKLAYAPKTKIPPSPKRDNLAKDYICHHCKEVGQWRRNCSSYHAELKKRKNASKGSTSVSQLTSPYTPQHNEVTERRNRTLLDMVRSMMNVTTLPKSFWGYALETATRILNMVPTKKVEPQNVGVPICKSVRIPQAPDRYGYYVDVEEYDLGDLDEPPNYKSALAEPESKK